MMTPRPPHKHRETRRTILPPGLVGVAMFGLIIIWICGSFTGTVFLPIRGIHAKSFEAVRYAVVLMAWVMGLGLTAILWYRANRVSDPKPPDSEHCKSCGYNL